MAMQTAISYLSRDVIISIFLRLTSSLRINRQSSLAGTSIIDLPQDIIIAILLRLPVKSLLHCLLVCKSFRAIIKSHEFIHLHLKHENQHQEKEEDYIFIYHHPHKKPFIPTKHSKSYFGFYDLTFSRKHDLTFHGYTDILMHWGCRRGLVCFNSSYNVYFWNPALSMCRTTEVFYREPPSTTAFIVFGFGFVPRINDFKLVRLKRDCAAGPGKYSYEVDVYTLGSNSWRRINNNVSGRIKKYPTACVNGFAYWRAEATSEGTSSTGSQVYSNKYILGFDLDDEVFHEMTVPDNLVDFMVYEYKESLCISCLRGVDACEVWLRKGYGTSEQQCWIKLHSFIGNNFIFWFTKTDELLVPANGGKLYLRDPTKNGQVKKALPPLENVGRGENDVYYLQVFNYSKSLVLLDQTQVVNSKKIGLRCEKEKWYCRTRTNSGKEAIILSIMSCLIMLYCLWLKPFN